RRLLARSPDSLLKYTEYIDGCGMALFQRVCELDLEGIVAKQKFGPYATDREQSSKILRALCRSSLEKKPLSTDEDTSFFFGMVKPQPGDISIVDKPGTFLMWYDTGGGGVLTTPVPPPQAIKTDITIIATAIHEAGTGFMVSF